MKYTLICEDKHSKTKIIHEFHAVGLSDMLEQYEAFLKGCGFVFDGTLDIEEPYEDDFKEPKED